jgi:hypothetical protein
MTQFAHSTTVALESSSSLLTMYVDWSLDNEKEKTRLQERGKELVLASRAALWKAYDFLKRFPKLATDEERNLVTEASSVFFVMPDDVLEKWSKDEDSPPKDLKLMLQVLTKSLTGLMGSQYLKIGNLAPNELGRVRFKDAAEFDKTKPYHNNVKDLSADKAGPARASQARHLRLGAISISKSQFFLADDFKGRPEHVGP